MPAPGNITNINNVGTAQILSGAATTNFLNIGNNVGNAGIVIVQNNGTTPTASTIFVGANGVKIF